MRSSATLLQHPVDSDDARRAQQQRLRALRDELVAEGADPQRWYETLRIRADAWPE